MAWSIRRLLVGAQLLTSLAGCGGADKPDVSRVPRSFVANGIMVCPNADLSDSVVDGTGATVAIRCDWHCVTNEGVVGANVFRAWARDDSAPDGWRLAEDTRSSAPDPACF